MAASDGLGVWAEKIHGLADTRLVVPQAKHFNQGGTTRRSFLRFNNDFQGGSGFGH